MKVGDRVLAAWPAELEWWYPGTIVAIEGDLFDVIYEDGDRANLTLEQVKPLTIGVGTRVYANWKARAEATIPAALRKPQARRYSSNTTTAIRRTRL